MPREGIAKTHPALCLLPDSMCKIWRLRSHWCHDGGDRSAETVTPRCPARGGRFMRTHAFGRRCQYCHCCAGTTERGHHVEERARPGESAPGARTAQSWWGRHDRHRSWNPGCGSSNRHQYICRPQPAVYPPGCRGARVVFGVELPRPRLKLRKDRSTYRWPGAGRAQAVAPSPAQQHPHHWLAPCTPNCTPWGAHFGDGGGGGI